MLVMAKSVFYRRVRSPDVYFSVLFIYLLWDPNVLFDIGFQLSLLAMWGIVFLVPSYLRRFEESHSVIQWLANTVVVSIICTLTTVPIIFKEFEQLSLWFLVGNLLLMPLFNWLIYGYAFFFILGFSEVLLMYFAFIINRFIQFIDFLMLQFSQLPNLYLYSPRWGWTEFLLFLLVVVFWTFYREEKAIFWKQLCLFALFVMSVEYSIALYICD
jgi:competence protein ComEC